MDIGKESWIEKTISRQENGVESSSDDSDLSDLIGEIRMEREKDGGELVMELSWLKSTEIEQLG